MIFDKSNINSVKFNNLWSEIVINYSQNNNDYNLQFLDKSSIELRSKLINLDLKEYNFYVISNEIREYLCL